MRIFYYALLLLIISFELEAQQVKKIDCCQDVTPKATIIINGNTSSGVATASNTNNSTNGVFNFTLSAAASTSAGVYSSSGVLIRTLWSGVRYDAGCYTGLWDGLTDDGTQAPNGSYNIKVLSNNVTYAFEGYIGNTSTGQSYKSFGGFGSFAFAGSRGYLGDSFAEGGVQTHYFELNNIQQSLPVDIGLSAIIQGVATDGTNLYWAGVDQYQTPQNDFIFATKVSDNTNYVFSQGINLAAGRGATTANSVIGYKTGLNSYNSIAVQANGNLLFAASDSLSVFNKISGALLKKIPVNFSRVAAGTNNELWAIVGNVVKKYIVAADGTLSDSGISISGLAPLSLAISPDNSTLSICDNSTSQIKSYFNNTGAATWTLGQLNGYNGSPAAANDKFSFLAANYGASYIAYLPDGSLWVNSPGEYCVKHFNADRTYKERISYIPSFRSACIDENDPTSIFADELEFQRDYSKPLDNGSNGSWKLKNVWTPGTTLDLYGKFKQVVTLSNGHKYGYGSNGNLYDLTSTGSVFLGYIGNNASLEADGSLWTRDFPDNTRARIIKQVLTGFGNNNMPQWGPGTTVILTPVVNYDSPFFYVENTFGSSTNTNRFIFFNPNHNNSLGNGFDNLGTGHHLGSLKFGATAFDWLSSASTFNDYHGDYPRNGNFDIGNNDFYSQHSENARVLVNGPDILTQVNAEFWQANAGVSGVNIFNHYDESGLLVGNFGLTAIEAANTGKPGMTGNGYSIAWAKVNGEYHIVQCDESNHGAITCWKISNLASKSIQTVPVTVSAAIVKTIDPTDLMAGLPFMSRTFAGDTNWVQTTDNSSSVMYTNYFQYQSDSVDIYVGSAYHQLVTRKLNNAATLNNWKLSGELSTGVYGQPTINYNEHWSYLEILDVNSKIIARYTDFADSRNGYYHTTYINNIAIKSGNPFNAEYPFNKGYQPFAFSFSGSSFTFKLNAFAPVTVNSPYEAGANMAAPAYLRINNGSNGGQMHVIDLAGVAFMSSKN